MTFPEGLGMGATQDEWSVGSLSLAAGSPPIITVVDPLRIIPGPPGTQPGNMQGVVVSETRAAGDPPISTVGCPLMIVRGRAGCAEGVGTGAGG